MYYLCSNEAEFFDKYNLGRIIGGANTDRTPIRLDYILENKGNPLACMRGLSETWECRATLNAYHQEYREFRLSCSHAGKLAIMAATGNYSGKPYEPYYCAFYAITSIFYPLMSDNERLLQWLLRHKEKILFAHDKLNSFDAESYMRYTLFLAIEGKDWAQVIARSEAFLQANIKRVKKRIPDHEFFIALAHQDVDGMKTALGKILKPRRNAKTTAYDTLAFLDFYLQPQLLAYGKLASRYGFDLGIDEDIAPKELIVHAPLESYPDAYEFMQGYDWDAPFEFQEEWIKRYKGYRID